MDLNNIPLMSALKKSMHWLNANQTVLSENVANANTPGYRAKELAKQDFSGLVDDLNAGRGMSVSPVSLRTTNAGHFEIGGGQSGAVQVQELKGVEESADGNSVSLEEEMLKVANNQMKYGMMVNLYKKNLGLLKIALGRNG